MLIGEAGRKKKVVEFEQSEMFPDEFHEHYVVKNHHYYIGDDGKSYWSSSQITWRIKQK